MVIFSESCINDSIEVVITINCEIYSHRNYKILIFPLTRVNIDADMTKFQ